MAKRAKADKTGFTDTGLPTPATATERTATATGQPVNEYMAAARKGAEIISKMEAAPEYRSHQGRRRYNTMMHPDLIDLLAKVAKGKGATVPDLIEEIICKALGIDPPSEV